MFGSIAVSMLGVVFIGALLSLWIYSIGWAYKDANLRGKSGVLVALMVALLSWPLGLVAWLVFRPDDKLVIC